MKQLVASLSWALFPEREAWRSSSDCLEEAHEDDIQEKFKNLPAQNFNARPPLFGTASRSLIGNCSFIGK
jgi:hypothetical protein